MDELLSFGLAAGLAGLLVGSIGVWAWRRKVRSRRTAVGDAHGAAATFGGTVSSLTTEGLGLAPGESAEGVAGCGDTKGGRLKGAPPDGAAPAGTSVGEDKVQAHSTETALPAGEPPTVEEDPPREHAKESSASDTAAAPPVEAEASIGEKGEVGPPVSDHFVAAAKEEEPKEECAGDGQGLDGSEPLAAETRPKTEPPHAPGEFSGFPAINTAGQADTNVGQPSDAITIERIPADQDELAPPHPAVDAIAADGVPPSPPNLQGSADNTAERMAEPRDRPDQVMGWESAAASDNNEQDNPIPEASPVEPPSEETGNRPIRRPRRPAKHRDRRGGRRIAGPNTTPPEDNLVSPTEVPRSPAEARLRLSLHPIRRTARLSVVLGRPDGFPQWIVLDIDGNPSIEAYSERRYDDLDLAWSEELLDGEFRVASTEGFHWLRSARKVHIFAEDPNEPDLVSVGAARAGASHTVVCRSGDTAAVRAAAASTRSPELASCEGWQGIPDGWSVLSGYAPARAATPRLPAALRPLDPGAQIEIGFEDGLRIRSRVFAEGHPPRISISPEPVGEAVTIGGRPAALAAGGGWEAPGWDTPGHHLVDVVPGPSASYEILADPWRGAGWEFWNAYPGRFDGRIAEPCACAEVCGASIRGPEGQVVLVAETRPTLIALGLRNSAVPLRRRSDIHVSVGFVFEPPAFLLSAIGQRRSQGRVIWLGHTPIALKPGRADPEWVAAVRWATLRRLPLEDADSGGEGAWRNAKARARQLKKSRR